MTTTSTSERKPPKPRIRPKVPHDTKKMTVERAIEALRYDPATGLIYRKSAKGERANVPAGHVHKNGYVKINLDSVIISAHRFAWMIFYGEIPKGQIDHIDRNKGNNRIENLRLVNHQINQQNRGMPSRNNKTGFLGVTKMHGKFRASIRFGGKQVTIGFFNSPEEASEAYKNAKRVLHEGCTI